MYSKDAHLARIARMAACASISVMMAASIFTALPSFVRAEEEAAEPEATVEEVAVSEDEADELGNVLEATVEEVTVAEDAADSLEAVQPVLEVEQEESLVITSAAEEPVIVAAAPSKVGWVEVSGHWTYYNANGEQMFGFQQVNNKWYYLDPDNSGYMVENSVFEVTGSKYVADANGVCQTSKWVKVDGKWYFTGVKHGDVCTGWIKVDGKNYYMGNDGVMRTGAFKVSGKNYIADASGACKASQWVLYDGKWYLTDASCACRTGWAFAGGNWYYMGEDGAMATGWVSDGGAWYYMSDSGAMCTGWKLISGDWYYFRSSGAMATGWVQDKGLWYYLDPNTGIQGSGKMISNEKFNDGKHDYIAKPSGECPADAWVWLDGAWYRTNSSCAIRTGWYQVNDVWYFSNSLDGKMLSSTPFKTGGMTYIATASGACPANAWVKLAGYWYYTGSNCACRSGWVKYNNDWYYMHDTLYYMLTSTTTPDGYPVDANGKWIH